MSYSNSYLYSVSNKAQFERPTIPPILKLAQQHQQTSISNNNSNYITTTSNNAKSNIFSHSNNSNTNKFNSTLSSNSLEAAAEKKFLRQRKLLQEHQEQFPNINNNNRADADTLTSADFDPKVILQKSKHLKHKRSSNYNTSTWSSLAASFPGFYLNPNETNYVKLINSILNSKLKPSAKLTLSPSIEVEIRSKKTTDQVVATSTLSAASEEFYLNTSIRNNNNSTNNIEVGGDRLHSNSCLNMHSIDEESSNMMGWDQSSSQSFSGANTRSRTEFDLKINAMLRQSNRPKSPTTTSSSSNRKAANRLRSRRNASNGNSASSSGDVNYRLSSSNKKGLSHKFFVSQQRRNFESHSEIKIFWPLSSPPLN